MIRNEHINEFNPTIFDLRLLEEKYESVEDQFVTYEDPRGKHDGFMLNRVPDFDYANKICKDLGIESNPRFYTLDPHTYLVPHKDYGTSCSINILLYGQQDAPINVEGSEYTYNACVLNVQKEHSVRNGPLKRILFKLSIFNQTYEEVCDIVNKNGG